MQAEQTVLSLRPGGGTRGGSRFLGLRFDSSSEANTDLPVVLRPHGGGASSLPSIKTRESRFHGLDRICYTRDQLLLLRETRESRFHGLDRICYTRDQLLELKEVAIIPDDILKAKQEVDAEFFGEDPSWAHGESNLENQGQNRYSQLDNRDWRNRLAQFRAPAEERSWERQQDINQHNRQEQLSSQFARISSNQGLEGSSCLDKEKSSQVIGSTGDAPQLPKAADEDADAILRSIQGLFSSWERAKTSEVFHSSSSGRPSVASAASSEENLRNLKQLVLDYVSFMDMNVNQASVSSQKETFERLGAQMAQALELPSPKISSDIKLTLKVIHSEIGFLLAKDAELKTKQTRYLHAVSEKTSLFQEMENVKSHLSEISSEVMVEDSLMMSLTAEMKVLQAKMDDCKARLAAKKRNVSQEVERSASLVERYTSLVVDEGVVTELSNAADEHRDEWERLREQMRSVWGRL